MLQYEAVEIISKHILETNLVDAIFLKGSLARGSEDEYSNIDLYCLINNDNYLDFERQEIAILRKYNAIIYLKNNNNQLICVFENGILLNFYTLRINNLDYTDDIVIIHDPKGILANYEKIPLEYLPIEVGEILDQFLLKSIEFYNAMMRDDNIYSFMLASELFNFLGIFLRIKYDSEFAKMGLKMIKLDEQVQNKYYEIAKKLKINSVLECVKMIYVLLDNYINNIPILFAEHINFDFYSYTKRKIMSIN